MLACWLAGYSLNTPGTRGGSGGRDRTLPVNGRKKAQKSFFFVKNKNYKKIIFFLHISSSYAKILGETNFHTRENPQSGSKAKDGEKREKRKKED